MKRVLVVLALAAVLLGGCAPTEPTGEREGLHPTVPSVIGMPLGEAQDALEEAGYEVGSVTPEGADPKQEVSRQDPVEGTTVPRGGKIDLTVKAQ